MSTPELELDFSYIATCIRYHVQCFNNGPSNYIDLSLFKSIYGLTPLQTAVTWNNLIGSLNVLDSFRKKHLLWTLRFLRHYQTKQCLAHDLMVAPGTLMKWVWYTIDSLSELKIVSSTTYPHSMILTIYDSHASTFDRLNFQTDYLTASHTKSHF